MEPVVARKTFRTLEPIHGLIYFAPEAVNEYAALGVTGRSGYFASRSAPMGAVSAELVIATFFNFDPGLVRHAMNGVWDTVTPAALLEARLRRGGRRAAAGGGRSRRRRPTSPRRPARAGAPPRRRAGTSQASRLFAGHATLAWPEDPLLVLWHAQSLLREFRGDIHIAAMTRRRHRRMRGAGHSRRVGRDSAGRAADEPGVVRRRLGRGGRLTASEGSPRRRRRVHRQGASKPAMGRGPNRRWRAARVRGDRRRRLRPVAHAVPAASSKAIVASGGFGPGDDAPPPRGGDRSTS